MTKQFKFILGMCLCVVFMTACATPSKKVAEQQIVPVDRERELSVQLSHNIDQAFGAWKAPALENILDDLLDRMVLADAGYKKELRNPHAHLLETAVPYVAAGLDETIYLSRGLLNAVHYENELAFILGTQLALLKEHVAARNLANLQGQELGENLIVLPTAPPILQRDYLGKDWFQPGGLFDFGSEAYLKAEQEGIRLAYRAKYDPRGAVTLIKRWSTPGQESLLKPLGKILPEHDERLNTARDEVAKLSPLRDPIVNGRVFADIQTQLRVKKAKKEKKKT